MSDHKISSQTDTKGKLHSIEATGPGYKIVVKDGEEPNVELDHSIARSKPAGGSGEVERLTIGKK